jgi:hypothetical protein
MATRVVWLFRHPPPKRITSEAVLTGGDPSDRTEVAGKLN